MRFMLNIFGLYSRLKQQYVVFYYFPTLYKFHLLNCRGLHLYNVFLWQLCESCMLKLLEMTPEHTLDFVVYFLGIFLE